MEGERKRRRYTYHYAWYSDRCGAAERRGDTFTPFSQTLIPPVLRPLRPLFGAQAPKGAFSASLATQLEMREQLARCVARVHA